MKKIISLVLFIIAVSMLTIGANASGETASISGEQMVIQPRWDDASTVNCTISFTSGSKNANINACISGRSGTTSITATLTLYKGSGDNLTYMKSWVLSGTQLMLFTDSSYACASGSTYTLKLSGTVYRNGNSEAVSDSDYAVCP